MVDGGGRRGEHLDRLIAELEAAGEMAHRALDDLIEMGRAVRRDVIEGGSSLYDAYDVHGIVDVRERVFEAEARLTKALTAVRAEAVRLMVEDEGMSLSAVARVSQRSRQFVTRLYEAAVEAVRPDVLEGPEPR